MIYEAPKEQVEAVARMLSLTDGRDPDEVESGQKEPWWKCYELTARAALAAAANAQPTPPPGDYVVEEGWVAVWDWPGEKCHGRWEAWTMHKDREETVARSQCMSMSPDRRKVVRYRLTYGEGSGLPAAPLPGDRIESAARAMWEVNGNDVSFDYAKDAGETAYFWIMDMARAALSARAEQAEEERDRLADKVEGLEAEISIMCRELWGRGAKEFVRLNFKEIAERLEGEALKGDQT